MTAVASFARIAREALDRTTNATLHIQGVDTVAGPDCDVLLYDDDGTPTFLCPDGSPVAAAATTQRLAVLTVMPAAARDAGGVVLAGRLTVVGSEQVDGTSFAVVVLQLSSVLVEIDDPRRPAVRQHEVPLAHYRAWTQDPVGTPSSAVPADPPTPGDRTRREPPSPAPGTGRPHRRRRSPRTRGAGEGRRNPADRIRRATGR